MNSNLKCGHCYSLSIVIINTYKHYAYICNDCGNVTHHKKNKYFLEYLLPRQIMKYILPKKAFLRLFSDKGEFIASEFYDDNSFETTTNTKWRKSEITQVIDQLNLINFNPKGKKILDISGGPGHVASALSNLGANVFVTEYSKSAVSMMSKTKNLTALVFDYNNNKLEDIVSGNFDLIMVRSSIIFCNNLDEFVLSLSKLVNKNGFIMLETILPTLGEIFWWQQLEYKFTNIYTQESIEKNFFNHEFKLYKGYKDYGGYCGVKYRSYDNLTKQLFTWLIDFPMVVFYYILAYFQRPNIDHTLSHKMLTQFWTKKNLASNSLYLTFFQGQKNKSKTFGYEYNGYLKNKKCNND